jgi:hypothetical protein
MASVNLWAVLVAAVVNFIIGFLFHGPVLGKTWMRLANVTPTGNEKFADMIPQMVKNLVVNFIFAYVLAMFYMFASPGGASTGGAWNGMVTGFWVWLGFVVTTSSIEVIWMKRSHQLWLFECFASLVGILAMGAIIASWY